MYLLSVLKVTVPTPNFGLGFSGSGRMVGTWYGTSCRISGTEKKS